MLGVLITSSAAVEWLVKAVMDGVFGLALGMLMIPVATRVIGPIWEKVASK